MTSSRYESLSAAQARIDELELELLAVRDHVIGCEAKLGELRAEVGRGQLRAIRIQRLGELRLRHAENERAVREDLEQQLKDLKASTSWRVGRAVVAPAFSLRSSVKRP